MDVLFRETIIINEFYSVTKGSKEIEQGMNSVTTIVSLELKILSILHSYPGVNR